MEDPKIKTMQEDFISLEFEIVAKTISYMRGEDISHDVSNNIRENVSKISKK